MTTWDDAMSDLADAEIEAFPAAIRYSRIGGRAVVPATGAFTDSVELDQSGAAYVACNAHASAVTVDMFGDAKILTRDFTFLASDVSNPKAGDLILLTRDASTWAVTHVESLLEGNSWRVKTKRHVAGPPK